MTKLTISSYGNFELFTIDEFLGINILNNLEKEEHAYVENVNLFHQWNFYVVSDNKNKSKLVLHFKNCVIDECLKNHIYRKSYLDATYENCF